MFLGGFIVGSAVTFIGVTIYGCLVVASRANQKAEDEEM